MYCPRPRKDSNPYTLRLSDEDRLQLKAIAKAQGVSAHSIAIAAVKSAIAKGQAELSSAG